MNNKRRAVLNRVLDEIEKLNGLTSVKDAINILRETQMQVEKCADMEQDALDNRPESFAWSAGNDAMQENVSDLNEASDDLELLVTQCAMMAEYDYSKIRKEVIGVVNGIKKAIHR